MYYADSVERAYTVLSCFQGCEGCMVEYRTRGEATAKGRPNERSRWEGGGTVRVHCDKGRRKRVVMKKAAMERGMMEKGVMNTEGTSDEETKTCEKGNERKGRGVL